MRPFLEGGVGNPAALHSLGLEARASLDGARAKVGRLVGGAPGGVVFTAERDRGQQPGDPRRGVAGGRSPRGDVVRVEHVSIRNPCRDLEERGWSVTWLPVDGDGPVDPDAVGRALRPDTALVSIMAANGEIGIAAAGARDRPRRASRGVPFHVDGVGAVGRLPLSVDDADRSAHSLVERSLRAAGRRRALGATRVRLRRCAGRWAGGRLIARAPRTCRRSSAWAWPPT